MGWAMPAAADAELSRGDGADLLEIGGRRLGVVSASEGVALPGQAYDPPSLSVKEGWQARLDGLSDALGVEKAPGSWCLHAWKPYRAWLFWGLVYRSAAVPWGQTIDFESHETWQQRWARKTAEFGDDKMACPVKVGRTAGGGWWIGLKPSIIGSAGAVPKEIRPTLMQAAWRDAMSDFCLKMGIGSQAAAWHLLAGEEKEPDEG